MWISNHNHFGMLFDKNCFCIFYLKNILIFQHWKWPAQGISTLPTVLDAFVANTELLQRTPVKQHWPGRTSTHRHESESSDVPPQSHLRHFTHKHAEDWLIELWFYTTRIRPQHATSTDPDLPARPTAANLQQWVCRCGPMLGQRDRWTGGWTLYHFTDPALHSVRAVPTDWLTELWFYVPLDTK